MGAAGQAMQSLWNLGQKVTEEGGAGSWSSPPVVVKNLGSAAFCQAYGAQFPYMAGAMARGIASVELVEAMTRAGLVASFGAAGLSLGAVRAAVERLNQSLAGRVYLVNLIHSPQELALESQLVDLFLELGVKGIEASAFMDLSLEVVRFRLAGLRKVGEQVVSDHLVMVKVSREELARKYLAPPPQAMVEALVSKGAITAEQAALAASIPVATDITAEADSGGHTDNQPSLSLWPTILSLSHEAMEQYGYPNKPRIGAAGGIGSPEAVYAAYAMGMDYVVTGSINQACREAGTSDLVKELLAKTRQGDVAMAPAADMFEMGIQVQVIKNQTMFPMRAKRLWQWWREFESLDSLPEEVRLVLEDQYFRMPLSAAWQEVKAYFQSRQSSLAEKATRDGKLKMALLFRSYLGQSSHWAHNGEKDRQLDFQVWCGKAMGSFNQWCRGRFLEAPKDRKVVTVAFNLLFQAGFLHRVHGLRTQGVLVDPKDYPLPMPLQKITQYAPEFQEDFGE